jgi:hypothetical protein
VVDFLEEHWHKEGIQAGFAKLGPVIDIDPACLDEGDRSILQVVMARCLPLGILDSLYGANTDRAHGARCLSSTFSIEVIRVWPWIEPLDALGNLCCSSLGLRWT